MALPDISVLIGMTGGDVFARQLSTVDSQVSAASKNMDRALTGAMLAGAAVFGVAVKASMDFESSFTGVTKTVEGLRDPMGELNESGKALARGFIELSKEIPISVNELNRIGEIGGQLGIPREALLSFTETIAQLGKTTDLSVEAASQSIARFINVTQKVAPEGSSMSEQVERIGSTIVALGNTFATSESQIVELAQRMAGAGAVIGLTQDEILSMAAALSAVGVEAQAGGTAMQKLFIGMANSVKTGSDELEIFANVAGKSIPEFAELFSKDASEAIDLFISGLGKIQDDGENIFATLKDLGLNEDRLRSALLLASSASNRFSDSLKIGSKAYKDNNALTQEAIQRFNTLASQLQRLGNVVYAAFIAIGDNLTPTIKKLADALADGDSITIAVVKGLGDLAIALGVVAGTVKIFSFLDQLGVSMENISKIQIAGFVGSIVFTAGRIIDLVDKIGQFKKANKTLEETTAANNKVQEKGAENYKKLLDSMTELANLDPTKQVLLQGKLMTAFEATQSVLKVNNDLVTSGVKVMGDFSLVTDEAAIKTFIATEKQKKHAEALAGTGDAVKNLEEDEKAFKDAGITTTQAIKDQIIKYEALQKTLSKNDIGYGQINEKLKELNAKLPIEAQYAKMADDAMASLGDAVGSLAIRTPKLTAELSKLKTTDELLADAGIMTEDSIKAQIKYWTDYLPIAAKSELATKQVKEKIKELEDELKTTKISTEDLIGGLGSLWDKFGDGNETVGAFIDVLSNIAQGPTNAIGIITSGFSLLGSILGYTHEKITVSIDDMREKMGALGDEIVRLNELTSSLGDNFRSDILDDYADKLAYAEEYARQFYETMVNTPKNMRGGMKDDYEEIQGYIQSLTDEMARLTEAFQVDIDFTSGIDGLQYLTDEAVRLFDYFGSGADLSGIKELLQEQIALNETMLAGLDPASQAYRDLADAIGRGREALAYLNGETLSFGEETVQTLAEKLSSLGIETEDSVRSQIDSWSDLLLELDEGSYEYEQVRDKIEALYAKLGEEAPWQKAEREAELLQQALEALAEPVVALADLLKDAGIETEDAVWEQITSLESLMGKVDEGSYEYEQIKKKLEALYGKLGLKTAWQAAEENAQKLAEELKVLEDAAAATQDAIAKQRDEIAMLEAQLAARNAIVEHIDDIKAAIDILNSPDVNFDNIEQTLIDLGVKTGVFAVEWGAALGKMLTDYDQFNADMKTASDAIDTIKSFKIDLDTTTADESINALIFRWQDYLATLDPSSSAYKTGQESLNALIKKFKEMGGVIDEQSAIDFNIALAEGKIDELGNELEEMPTEQEIQMQIADALENLNILIGSLADILARIHGLETEDIDISTNVNIPYDRFDILYNKIDGLSSTETVLLNTDDATTKLGSLKTALDTALATKTVTVDVSAAKSKLDELETKASSYVYLLKNLDTYHSGGVITAHGGAYLGPNEVMVKALKGEAVLNTNLTSNIGASNINAANATGNPAFLGGSSQPVNVMIQTADPLTTVRFVDTVVTPRSRDTNRNTITVKGY